MLFRRVRADDYLKGFMEFCKKRFGDNLVAVVIFGSYPWGYFDRKKSDYDVILFFKNPVRINKRFAKEKFGKVDVHYLLDKNELISRAHLGHWTTYITLLKSARVIYSTREYRNFLRELKGLNLFEAVVDVAGIEAKAAYEIDELKKKRGYKALKWSLPMLRKRLQMLTYLRFHKLVWDMKKNLRRNKDILDVTERRFLGGLDRKLRIRSNDFDLSDKKMVLEIMNKLNVKLLFHLSDLVR